MNIGIDLNQLLNSQLNDLMLKAHTGNKKADQTGVEIVKFANKYGFFGVDAMNFVIDLFNLLEKLGKINNQEET